MRFAICNEFCEKMPLADVFRLARSTGYKGVELAPFTIAADVRQITAADRRQIRQQAADAGVAIVGLHWLLVQPAGLYLNHPDRAVRERTADYLRALIDCCGDLGGSKMVFGSPKQRNVHPDLTYDQAWAYAREAFTSLLPHADARGVDLCLEPLGRAETNFIVTAAEALRLVKEIRHPRFRVHLDVKAMTDEGRPLDKIITACRGYVGHVHANDANLGYPGSGNTDFGPVAKGLAAIGYDGWVSVEVFDFTPGPQRIAEESIRYLERIMSC